MHQPAEREQQEDRHAEQHVHLEGPGHRRQRAGVRAQRCDALQVARQDQHGACVLVMRPRQRQRDEAEGQLDPQDHEDRQVRAVAGQPDARVEDAPVQEQRQAGEADQPRHTPGDDRQQLLLRSADERFVHPVRRELPEQVPEEQEQDAGVEQVAAPPQRPGAQHLRRVALPRVLVAVESGEAAHQEHGQAHVRIDDESEIVEIGTHCWTPTLAAGAATALTVAVGCAFLCIT